MIIIRLVYYGMGPAGTTDKISDKESNGQEKIRSKSATGDGKIGQNKLIIASINWL